MNHQDKGYAWVILACCFSFLFVVAGSHKCLGVLYVDLLELFQKGAFSTSLVSTGMTFSWCLSAPLIGCLVDMVSGRALVIFGAVLAAAGFAISSFAKSLEMVIMSLGLLSGVSMSFMEVPLLTALNRYFNKKKGVASSLAYIGSSIGSLVFPLLFTLLTETYSVRGTLLLLAGIWFNCAVMGALLRPFPTKKKPSVINNTLNENQSHKKEILMEATELSTIKQSKYSREDFEHESVKPRNSQKNVLLCNFKFIRSILIACLGGFAAYGSLFVLPALALEWGSSKIYSSTTISIYAGFEVVSRLLLALILDRKYVQKHTLLFVSFLLASLSGTCTFFISTKEFLVVHAAVIGIVGFIFAPVVVPIIAECVKYTQLGRATGLYLLALGLGLGVAYPVIGATKDLLSSFSYSLLVSSGAYFFCAVIAAIDVPFYSVLSRRKYHI